MIQSSLYKNILNGILFQVGWFSCVIYGTQVASLVALLILTFHYFFISSKRKEWIFIIMITLFGFIIDTSLMQFGVFDFNQESWHIPIWIVAIWALFSSTLFHALNWLNNYALASILGAISGPTSYYAGIKLSGASFGIDSTTAIITLVLVWACILPLCLLLKNQLIRRQKN